MNSEKKVVIVGGGLAGMATALQLLERGYHVTIYEASERLGGKAGASMLQGGIEEHGYHIFPMWYLNIWELVKRLDLQANFIDCADFEQLKPNEYPRFRTMRNITDWRSAWFNLTSGVLPLGEMFLFFYATIDLLSQRYDNRAFLDQTSISGFLRSRLYRTTNVALQFQDLMLKGISTPLYFVSAKTMQTVIKYWIRYPKPSYRILNGDLQTKFIEPFERKLVELGCIIYKGCAVEEVKISEKEISSLLVFEKNKGVRTEIPIQGPVVVSIPGEKAARLLSTDAVFEIEPRLSNLNYIEAQPMAALHIYYDRPIPELPADHVNLLESNYGLSFLDVSKRWSGFPNAVLNAIASDALKITHLSDMEAVKVMLNELHEYLPPLKEANIQKIVYQSHKEEPLFMNNVGVWHFRPETLPVHDNGNGAQPLAVENLFLAGDYCRTHIDLVCMEGAFSSGLIAAEAIRRRTASNTPPIEIVKPKSIPIFVWLCLKLILWPLAMLVKAWYMVKGKDA